MKWNKPTAFAILIALMGSRLLFMTSSVCADVIVSTAEELMSTVDQAEEGSVIRLEPGIYSIERPLELKTGMTLEGSGIDATVITPIESWAPTTTTLPDPEMKTKGLDSHAYLIRLNDKASDVTVSKMTLRGPQIHGAIFGFGNDDLHLHHLKIDDTLWTGIRTFAMRRARIHDCQFIDAGGKWKRGGEPGIDGGISGGGIFAVWMKDSEISHNRFARTQQGKENSFFGVKARQGKRCRIHHNTIEVNFSIELPFENDEDIEIDHNVCTGTISIPKHAGGPVPESGRTFHIHHNWMKSSYAIEFVRNGVEIDHNLFDFDIDQDHGNLISGFGRTPAKGPASFHHNLVSNPGRGVVWINEPYANFEIYRNHIITRTTATPRTEGLFAFNDSSDLSTIVIRDNLIECIGQPRPLLRKLEGSSIRLSGNRLVNKGQLGDNTDSETKFIAGHSGPEAPLRFQCGVHDEYSVDQWQVRPTIAGAESN